MSEFAICLIILISLPYGFRWVTRTPTAKEQQLNRLSNRISAYEEKIKYLKNIIKYATKHKNIDSIDEILVNYMPVDKEEFARLQIKCEQNINNDDSLFIYITNWANQEMFAAENILDELNKQYSIESKKSKDKLSFIKRKIS